MLSSVKSRIINYYEKNEQKVDLGFFLGGFLFDILTLSSIDDPLAILQQVVYLGAIGSFLYFDFLQKAGVWSPSRFPGLWAARSLIVHFLLGSLLSVYSLFFLKSASLFSSIVFVVVLFALMIANEMKSVQKSDVSLKFALFILCLFSFFSLLVPVGLGFVGWIPFLISLGCTAGVLGFCLHRLRLRVQDEKALRRFLLFPGVGVLSLFFVFYLMGWIPPVPISIQKMGVYHDLKIDRGQYQLSYHRPWWKFWQRGAQSFLAEPGDRVVFFVQIFSPSRFDDQVILNWSLYSEKQGWQSSDRIPISIKGGREEGFRGYTYKQNIVEGEWRVIVETTHGREIGRFYFEIEKAPAKDPLRTFKIDTY